VPTAYGTSQLNALRGEVLIETLELTIADFTVQFGPTRGASPSP